MIIYNFHLKRYESNGCTAFESKVTWDSPPIITNGTSCRRSDFRAYKWNVKAYPQDTEFL